MSTQAGGMEGLGRVRVLVMGISWVLVVSRVEQYASGTDDLMEAFAAESILQLNTPDAPEAMISENGPWSAVGEGL